MFDVIGKRRWFYSISLAITIPGLFFILLTPFTDAGLQFTIDYTGGTRWEIRFEDPNVTPDQVEAVFAEQGLEATAITTGSGFIEIKTETRLGLRLAARRRPPVADRGAERLAGRLGSPAASGSRRAPAPARRRARPPREPSRSASAAAASPASVAASPGAPSARASPASPSARHRQHRAPDPGQARRGRRGAARPSSARSPSSAA